MKLHKNFSTRAWVILAAVLLASFSISSSAAQKKVRVLRFSHHMQLTQAIQKIAEEMGAEIAEKTDGELKVEVYGASQIGGLKENTDALRYGTLDMGFTDLGTIATFYPLAGMGGLPFLFRDYEHVEAVYSGPVGEELTSRILKATGIRFLGYTHSGFRSIITKKKPVDSPTAMAGMKIRVPEIPMYLNIMKAFGANPTPIPLSEMYTSLQTGVVDGMECPNDILYTSKFYEVTDYVTRSRHVYSDNQLAISEVVYQSLTPEQQKIVSEAAKTASMKNSKAIIELDDEYYNGLLKEGLKEVIPNTEAFRNKVKPVWDEFVSKNPDAQSLIDQIIATK